MLRTLIIAFVLVAGAAALPGGHARTSARYLSPLERRVVEEINLARTRPEAYAEILEGWLRHYDGKLRRLPDRVPVKTKEGVAALKEAIRFLRAADPLDALRPSKGMSRGARDHVRDLGYKGRFGHVGSDGSTTGARISRYGTWKALAGENIAYGSRGARDIIAQLIIDDGVPDRGHRTNFFDSRFRVVGVAFGYHAVYGTMCVITLAGDYIE